MGNTAKRDTRLIERLKLEDRVVTLRRQGLTWQLIATELGYRSPSAAFKIWQKAYRRVLKNTNETVDEQRWNEIGRCEAILRGGLYQRAQKGELQAIDRFLKVQEAIRAMRGLDAPKATTLGVVPGALADGTPEDVARRVRELFGERAAPPASSDDEDAREPEADATDEAGEGGAGPVRNGPPSE